MGKIIYDMMYENGEASLTRFCILVVAILGIVFAFFGAYAYFVLARQPDDLLSYSFQCLLSAAGIKTGDRALERGLAQTVGSPRGQMAPPMIKNTPRDIDKCE